MRAKVHTEKHYVQRSVTTVAVGNIDQLVFALSVATPTGVDQVREGSTVSAVFVELWIGSDDNQFGSTSVTLEKVISDGSAMTFAQSQALGNYANKNNCLYHTQGLTPSLGDSGIPFVRQWFHIPKGKQRMSLSDKLVLNITGLTNGVNYCGFITYKEQF